MVKNDPIYPIKRGRAIQKIKRKTVRTERMFMCMVFSGSLVKMGVREKIPILSLCLRTCIKVTGRIL